MLTMPALQLTMEPALLSCQQILELTGTTSITWVLAAISTLIFRTSSKTISEFLDLLSTWRTSLQGNPLNWRVTLPTVRMLRMIKIQLKWLEAEKFRNYVKTKYYYFFVGYNKTMHVQFSKFFWSFWKMCHLRNQCTWAFYTNVFDSNVRMKKNQFF